MNHRSCRPGADVCAPVDVLLEEPFRVIVHNAGYDPVTALAKVGCNRSRRMRRAIFMRSMRVGGISDRHQEIRRRRKRRKKLVLYKKRLKKATVSDRGVLADKIHDADLVLISDYDKGVCTFGLLQKTIELAKARGIKVIADPIRGGDYSKYRGCPGALIK